MKNLNNIQKQHSKWISSGVTLIELTVVIVVVLTLISIIVASISSYREWVQRNDATQSLREIYTAQRTYLAENPTVAVSAVLDTDIIPYLSNGQSALPVILGLNDEVLAVNITTSPPILVNDPSGNSTDGLWDLGQ